MVQIQYLVQYYHYFFFVYLYECIYTYVTLKHVDWNLEVSSYSVLPHVWLVWKTKGHCHKIFTGKMSCLKCSSRRYAMTFILCFCWHFRLAESIHCIILFTFKCLEWESFRVGERNILLIIPMSRSSRTHLFLISCDFLHPIFLLAITVSCYRYI